MHDQPSVSELVQAVKNFIDETAGPNLSGHAAFHARVASNALATVLRDLEARQSNEDMEAHSLQSLLGAEPETDLTQLNKELCDHIRSGKLSLKTPGLLEHLKQTTIAQVEIDQPHYSGLKKAKL